MATMSIERAGERVRRPRDGVAVAAGLLVATVLTGLMAGFFYAYSVSVMVGLARVGDVTFIETMQAINATVRNAGFAPAFFGSLLVTGVVAAATHVRRRRYGRLRWWVTAAWLCYLAAFLVTMGISVPLNDELAAAGPPRPGAEAAAVRVAYEDPWVAWNLVRTVLSTAALALLVRAGLARPRADG